MLALKNAAMFERKKNHLYARLYRAKAAYWLRLTASSAKANMA